MISLFLNLGTPELMLIGMVLWPLILFGIVALDIVRNTGLNQNTKLLWIIIVLLAPIIGALIYLLWGRNNKSII